MANIKKQYKRIYCPVIKSDVKIEYHFVLVDDAIIGKPHMRGCDSKNKCDVEDKQAIGIESYKWDECPLYRESP
ncbi:MAG: hypothetical protein ABIK92_18685 [Pseudomonadota bacterium]